MDPEQVPSSLQTLQYIDLTDNLTEADYLKDESDLLRILKRQRDYHHEHKVLLTKALKWERQQRNPCILLQGYELQHADAFLKLAQQHAYGPLPLQSEFISESQRQPPGISLDVFVSYSRADSDFARKLNDGLQRQGKRTWFDQESIASGADFQQEIYKGIEASDHFLFILSPKSVNSPYCADEVEYAAKLNKRIITARHRAVEAAELHPELAKVQWIDFLGRDRDFAANFKELIRTLDADPEHLRFHTRLLMQAIAWDERGRREGRLLRGEDLSEAEQWLLKAAGKQPSPTALQGEYVAASAALIEANQKAAIGRQRVVIGGLVSLLALAVAGGGFAVVKSQEAAEQSKVAMERQQEAEDAKAETEKALAEAKTAQTLAEDKTQEAEDALADAKAAQEAEEEQRDIAEEKTQEAEAALATADEQRLRAEEGEAAAQEQAKIAREQTQLAEDNAETAEKNAENARLATVEAERQGQIALARQLAAQAASLQQTPSQFTQNTLLAIEAMRRLEEYELSTADAKKVLNDLRSMPVAQTRILSTGNGVSSLPLFSLDGRYVALRLLVF